VPPVPPDGRRAWRRLSTPGIAGAVLLLLVTAVAVGTRWRQPDPAARLPPLPDLGRQTPAVVAHLQDAYDAARQDPASIAAVGRLCRAYHADMFFDQAWRCYGVAVDLDPQEWRWQYYRALIDAERGGGDALAESLRQIVARTPGFGPAWLRLGDAEFKAGRYAAAREAWARASELDEPPRDGGSPANIVEIPLADYASLGLSRLALMEGDVERAREGLERLAASAPAFGSAFRLLADAYQSLGRAADAARAVYRANRLPPFTPYADPMVDVLARESRNSTLLLRLASESALSINAAWSEHLTRRAAEFDPGNPEVVVKLGRILRTVGRNEEALEWFQRYHEMVPDDVRGLAHIGSCLSALGRYQEAESYLRRALSGFDDAMTHFNLGLLLVVTGRLDEGIREYERALERDPAHADARLNLAAALARQGQLDRSSHELARLLVDDPENGVAHANLGFVLLQQGELAQARRELEEALRLEPGLVPAAEALESLPHP